jgi:hypothetical protein
MLIRNAVLLGIGMAVSISSTPTLAAQAGSRLSGRVIDRRDSSAVPFALVTIAGARPVAASAAGRFVVSDLTAGEHRVVVRQIGFHPETLMVRLDPNDGAGLTVMLRRNPIALEGVQVLALRCSRETGHPAPRAAVEALGENVARYLSLLRAHPVRDSAIYVRYDSLNGRRGAVKGFRGSRIASGDNWDPYVPARVVHWPLIGRPTVTPMSTGFFADTAFLDRHCFSVRDAGSNGSDSVIAIDFVPTSESREADWAGTVFMDAHSYVIRRLESRVVFPSDAVKLWRYSSEARFLEIAPGLIVVDAVHVVESTMDRDVNSSAERMFVTDIKADAHIFVRDRP